MYRLKQIDFNGNYEYFNLPGVIIIQKPVEFFAGQNYPNPSNPKTKIDYQIPFDGNVSLRVYDISGKEVSVIADGFKQADYYTAEFDGSNLASGVYFYRITADGEGLKFTKTFKMILLK
jgi:Secretion system C-terminal sorting domain